MIQGAFARARAPVALLPADPSYDAHLDVELLGRLVAEGVVGLAAEWASRRLLEIVDQLLGREVVVAAARGGGATGLLTPPPAPTLGTRQVRGGRTVRAGVCRFGTLVIFGALRAPAEAVPEMHAQAAFSRLRSSSSSLRPSSAALRRDRSSPRSSMRTRICSTSWSCCATSWAILRSRLAHPKQACTTLV